jgi:hypothetical protein
MHEQRMAPCYSSAKSAECGIAIRCRASIRSLASSAASRSRQMILHTQEGAKLEILSEFSNAQKERNARNIAHKYVEKKLRKYKQKKRN